MILGVVGGEGKVRVPAAGENLNIIKISNLWFSCSRSSTLLPSQKHRAGSKLCAA